MLIRPSLDVPPVLQRALQAFRAGDHITLAEAFESNARLVTQMDPKLAARLGLADVKKPVLATGAIGIMRFYEAEFSAFEVTHLDVLSAMKVGRDIAAVCEWSVKMRGTGAEFVGRCHNIWTMDRTGRKCVDARNVCKILTPNWDHPIN